MNKIDGWLSKASVAARTDYANLPQSKPKREELVYDLVFDLMEAEPFNVDGRRWAKRSQEELSKLAGVSVSSLYRIISNAPFVRHTKLVDGRKVTLIRLGVPDDRTDKHQANILSKMWREHMGRPTRPRDEYGCICGLVENWPKGHAPEILKLVLKDWPAFMSGVKFKMDELAASGQGKVRFYQWPNLAVIRRFHDVAIELWEMEKQAKVPF